MKSYRVGNNKFIVSAQNAETAINTPQTLDTSLLVDRSTVINIVPRREANDDELTGLEEASRVYSRGQTAQASLSFPRAQAQHFAFLLSFGLGAVSTSGVGAAGYNHTITPIDGDLDVRRSNPSFSAAMKFGEVEKILFNSGFINSVNASFQKDAFAQISADMLLTGKTAENIVEETVNALNDVTELTLAANGVHGTTAADRLDSIHQVRAETSTGVWEEMTVSAVSDATPAVLTIDGPGGDGLSSIDYKILYRADESGEAWKGLVDSISQNYETPLLVSDLTINWGGKWDGAAFQGGRTMRCEVGSVEYSLNNNGNLEFCVGEADDYAGRYFRDRREQTVTLSRELRDAIARYRLKNDEHFGLSVKAVGAEYESGRYYTVWFIFPKIATMNLTRSVDGQKNMESLEYRVLEDTTYGSVIVQVENAVATYAA
jgi:hypothetical protein